MTIIQFPAKAEKRAAPASLRNQECTIRQREKSPRVGDTVARTLTDVLWTLVMLTWPLVGRILPMDVVFQLIRMLFYWDTHGVHAGGTFVLHLGAYLSMYMFLVFHKPAWL